MSDKGLRPKTVVIGAGVIGASIAAELHSNGFEVCLVDAGIPGEAVSGASFAWVNCNPCKSPVSYWMLNLLGLESNHRLRSNGLAPWFHPTGSLALAGKNGSRPYASTLENVYRSEYSDIRARAPADELGPTDIATIYPYLTDRIAEAVYYPQDGWIDIRQMLFELISSLPADRILTTSPVHRVTSSAQRSGSIVQLTDGTSLRAEHVVIANGNGAMPLIEQLSPGLELVDKVSEDTQAGLVVETHPVNERLTTVLRAEGVWMRPTRDGGVVLTDPTIADYYAISDPALLDVPKLLIERAAKLAPGLGELKIRSVRISPRVWPRDGRTVCGWISNGVYAVLTHSGVTLASYLAECVREELEGGTVARLADYRPERFMKGG